MCGGACYINIILSFIILVVISYIEENILRSDTTEIILENKNIFLTKKKISQHSNRKQALCVSLCFTETGQLFN
jgi:hypothetical protein